MYTNVLLEMLWKQMVRSRFLRLKSTDVQQMFPKYNWNSSKKTVFNKNIVKFCIQVGFFTVKFGEKLYAIA